MAAAAASSGGIVPPGAALSEFGMFMSRSQNKPYWQRLDAAGRPTGSSTWQPPPQAVALLCGTFWKPLSAFTKTSELVTAWNSVCSAIGASPLSQDVADLPLQAATQQLLAAFAAVMKRSQWMPTARAFCIPEPPALLGPFKLLQAKPATMEGSPPGVVAVSVFSFAGAYRRPERYAKGLLALAEAVATHLPQWTLRVYADVSVTCGALLPAVQGAPLCRAGALRSQLGQCPPPVQEAWGAAWGALLEAKHVQIVWWEAPSLMASGKTEHLDCSGTFARMLPMVASAQAGTPEWAASPAADTPVLCTDADFGSFGQEIGILRMAGWVASQPAASRPAVLGLSPAGSPAERHQPSLGLPDMLAGSVLTTHRFPADWLWGYLSEGVKGGPLSLAASHTAEQRAIETSKGAAGGGRFSKCSSSFAYGVDELWMTRVLKGGAVLQDPPSNWWWVQLPNVDRAFGRAVDLLSETIATAPAAAASAPVVAAAAALATAAGDSAWASTASSGAGSDVSGISDRSSQQRWTRSVAHKAGLYTRASASDAGCPVAAFDASASGEFGKRLLAAMRAVATAAAMGAVKASPVDVASLQATVAQLVAALDSSGALVSVAKFTLGGGRVQEHHPLHEQDIDASLVHFLRTGHLVEGAAASGSAQPSSKRPRQ